MRLCHICKAQQGNCVSHWPALVPSKVSGTCHRLSAVSNVVCRTRSSVTWCLPVVPRYDVSNNHNQLYWYLRTRGIRLQCPVTRCFHSLIIILSVYIVCRGLIWASVCFTWLLLSRLVVQCLTIRFVNTGKLIHRRAAVSPLPNLLNYTPKELLGQLLDQHLSCQDSVTKGSCH